VGELTAWKLFAALSTSETVSVPAAVGVPECRCRGRWPRLPNRWRCPRSRGIVAAIDGDAHHLGRAIAERAVKLSNSVWPAFNDCTEVLPLFSV